jgi:energy-coupling factor transporter ATP-binding protein EcfA2
MEPMISFENFTFKYKGLNEATLKNINLTINKGEKVLIAGPSGSGKSTLAHCINGLIPFSYNGHIEGRLLVNGVKPYETSIFEVSKNVGTILQDQDAQFVGLSVGEDVAFALENEAVPEDIIRVEVEKSLKAVDMLKFINKSPQDLSGGQKQRVSLAGILSSKTPILLFDEPLANLDPASGKNTMNMISEIHEETGKTIVIVEHRIEDVLEQKFDKVVLVSEGEIKAVCTPDEILALDVLKKYGLREPLYIEALKYANCKIEKTDELSDINNLNKDKFKEALHSWYKSAKEKKDKCYDEKVLSIEKIKFSYDGKEEVIKDVSFEVYKGEIISILGNNGAGKSTLSKLITGINTASSGSIYFKGENVEKWSINKRGQHIGYVMQNPNHMITQHMIKDEVALGLKIRGFDEKVIEEKVFKALKICGLYSYRNWPVAALSYGQKKRLTIASILVLEPEVIILDEPTAGQDHKHYREFMEFVKDLSNEGMGIILITHDMYLALEYTNRAVVLSQGEKIADDKVSNILTNKEIIKQANLKETSLSKLADIIGVENSNDFVQSFIDYEKRVSSNE